MTKKKDLKKRIRTSAAKTGQTYAAARQAMLSGKVPPTPPLPPALPQTTLRLALERSGWDTFNPYFKDELLGSPPEFLNMLERIALLANTDIDSLRSAWAPIAAAACAFDLDECMRALAAAEPAFSAAGWRPDEDLPYEYEDSDEVFGDDYFKDGEETVELSQGGRHIATITLRPGARYRVIGGTHVGRTGRVIRFRGRAIPELAWMQFEDNQRFGEVDIGGLRNVESQDSTV